jgi:hypothetical protein
MRSYYAYLCNSYLGTHLKKEEEENIEKDTKKTKDNERK